MTIIRAHTKLRRTIAAKSLSEQELGERYVAQVATEQEAEAKGWQDDGPKKQEPLSEREQLVRELENLVGPLPSKFRTAHLDKTISVNLVLCPNCDYNLPANPPLQVKLHPDGSRQFECHHCGFKGKLAASISRPDKWGKWLRVFFATELSEILPDKYLAQIQYDDGLPSTPELAETFIESYEQRLHFPDAPRALSTYWNRAIDRCAQALPKHKVQNRWRAPKYLRDDRAIMCRASTRKLVCEIYPYLIDNSWSVDRCMEWWQAHPEWRLPQLPYKGIIAPALVPASHEMITKITKLETAQAQAYLSGMESAKLVRRIVLNGKEVRLAHGRRLWLIGFWQETNSMLRPRMIRLLKQDPQIIQALRTLRI